jgi:hypothetical protein
VVESEVVFSGVSSRLVAALEYLDRASRCSRLTSGQQAGNGSSSPALACEISEAGVLRQGYLADLQRAAKLAHAEADQCASRLMLSE